MNLAKFCNFFSLLSILILSHFVGFSQTTEEENSWGKSIDKSLFELERNNLDSALYFARQALSVFRNRSSKYHLTALLIEGRVLTEMDSIIQAEKKIKYVYNKLEDQLVNSVEFLHLKSTTLHLLGNVNSKSGKTSEAIHYFEECLLGWPAYNKRVEVVIELCKKLALEERHQDVIKYLRLVESDSSLMVQKIQQWILLGTAYCQIDLDQDGKAYLDKANNLTKKIPDSSFWQGKINTTLGEILLAKNQFDSSYFYFNKAQKLWTIVNSYENEIKNLEGLCFLFFSKSTGDSLVKYSQRSLILASKNNDLTNRAYFESVLCYGYLLLGYKVKASILFDQIPDLDVFFDSLNLKRQIQVVESWQEYYRAIGDEEQVQIGYKFLSDLKDTMLMNLQNSKALIEKRNISDENKLKYYNISSPGKHKGENLSNQSSGTILTRLSIIELVIMGVMGAGVLIFFTEIHSRAKHENAKLFEKQKEIEKKLGELKVEEEVLKNRAEEVKSALEDVSNKVLHLSNGRSIPHDRILFIKVREGVKGIVEIYTNIVINNKNGKKNNMIYRESISLISIEAVLPTTRFIKTHRSFIINMNYVVARSQDRKSITLACQVDDEIRIPVSRSFKKIVFTKIDLARPRSNKI